MRKYHDLYECVFSLIPNLELDRESSESIIQTITGVTEDANRAYFGEHSKGQTTLGRFGSVIFPFYSFGNVKSYFHLEYRELVIFAIYQSLMSEEVNFLDVGGNLGLHSLMVSKLPHKSISYFEPDRKHFDAAGLRFRMNRISKKVAMHNVAISDYDGKGDFVIVLDNTTSSHLMNPSRNAYGPLEHTSVSVRRFSDFLKKKQKYLAKIDVEGTEADLLKDISKTQWNCIDCIVEITNDPNAQEVFRMAKRNQLTIYSQKISWKKVRTISDLPNRYDQGSVLISKHLAREQIFRVK